MAFAILKAFTDPRFAVRILLKLLAAVGEEKLRELLDRFDAEEREVLHALAAKAADLSDTEVDDELVDRVSADEEPGT
jgi:hypothetical protein